MGESTEGKVRLDPKGNVVLAAFDGEQGRTALLYRGGRKPFVVARGYEESTGEWLATAGRYENPMRAYAAADPDLMEHSLIVFGTDDCIEALDRCGIDPTDANVRRLKAEAEGMSDWMAETAIEGGIEFLTDCARRLRAATGGDGAEGSACPECGEDKLLEGGRVEIEGAWAYQGMACLECGARWNDCYRLERQEPA